MRFVCCLLIVLSACGSGDQRELGVNIFSTDTIPSRFVVSLTGSLVMGLRSSRVYMQHDKSLILETPGALVVQKGDGVATITAVDTLRPIAVSRIGAPLDSADAAVVGKVVHVVRTAQASRRAGTGDLRVEV